MGRITPDGLEPRIRPGIDRDAAEVTSRALARIAIHEPSGHTQSMKTAISLPDAVFRDAERLARRLRKSRSNLYTEAVAEYVARHEPEAVTEALNQVAKKLDGRPDEFASAAARRVLERSEW